jgi:hypothetical protein
MKVLAQYVAALLVLAVAMPAVVGFGNCCEHNPSTTRVMTHHHCGHEQMKESAPLANSVSEKGCQCRVCPSALPKRADRQLPEIVVTVFNQPLVSTPFSTEVSARLYSYTDPPPEDSSVRRASLCTFQI